jgi:hypothetical protein
MKFANATKFNRKSGEAEGSAVKLAQHQRLMKTLLSPCHPDRSVAKWRDLLFAQPHSQADTIWFFAAAFSTRSAIRATSSATPATAALPRER